MLFRSTLSTPAMKPPTTEPVVEPQHVAILGEIRDLLKEANQRPAAVHVVSGVSGGQRTPAKSEDRVRWESYLRNNLTNNGKKWSARTLAFELKCGKTTAAEMLNEIIPKGNRS